MRRCDMVDDKRRDTPKRVTLERCWGCIQVVWSGSGRGRARVVDSIGTYVAKSVSLETLQECEGGGDQKRMKYAQEPWLL